MSLPMNHPHVEQEMEIDVYILLVKLILTTTCYAICKYGIMMLRKGVPKEGYIICKGHN
jgi:hypothetical protein